MAASAIFAVVTASGPSFAVVMAEAAITSPCIASTAI